jgi:hypothetical protein
VLEAPVVAGHCEDPRRVDGVGVLAVQVMVGEEGDQVLQVLLVPLDHLELGEQQVCERQGARVGWQPGQF